MEKKLIELRTQLREWYDLTGIYYLLEWDQLTYMPEKGAEARGRQIALTQRLAHERLTSSRIRQLLDELEAGIDQLPSDSDEAALIRVTRTRVDRACKLPPDFVARAYQHFSTCYNAWQAARPENDFSLVQPLLEKTLEVSREYASYFPGADHIADPLIDRVDHNLTTAIVHEVFDSLRKELVPLVEAIREQPAADTSCLQQHFPEAQQLGFSRDVLKEFGFQDRAGRLDFTPHPFTTTISLRDVRIAIRVKEDDLNEAFGSIVHEAGHALYEQNIRPEFEGSPLAEGTSSAVHESQSRLWENLVGRNYPFWQTYYPKLQEWFPKQLGGVELDTFYRALNRVQPSLIRADADEVTYNLHVMIRFDLEIDLLEGRLKVSDLPEAWRERYRQDLGVVPEDHADGVLQDVHWYAGYIGGVFQGYTIGNVLSAQFFQTALQSNPEIASDLDRGQFGSLLEWLRREIYQHGSKYTTLELVERVTGGPIQIDPYMKYLRTKYGSLYRLS